MKRTAAALAGAALLILTGCSADAAPDDAAWSECVSFYDEHRPDGIVDAESGKTLDSDRVCHSMIAEQGQDEFTSFWNDPDRVEDYARGF